MRLWHTGDSLINPDKILCITHGAAGMYKIHMEGDGEGSGPVFNVSKERLGKLLESCEVVTASSEDSSEE